MTALVRLCSVLLALAATPAFAHVTVAPKDSRAGAAQAYVVRTPNERQVPTVQVEGRFPAGLAVTALEPTPGWTLEARRDATGAVVGAVWSGSLPPGASAAFGVTGVNPPIAGTMTWAFVQIYADGERVEWSGPPGARAPAPRVELAPAP